MIHARLIDKVVAAHGQQSAFISLEGDEGGASRRKWMTVLVVTSQPISTGQQALGPDLGLQPTREGLI